MKKETLQKAHQITVIAGAGVLIAAEIYAITQIKKPTQAILPAVLILVGAAAASYGFAQKPQASVQQTSTTV